MSLLVPDTDNQQEMWMALTLIGSFARAGSEWVFAGALLILIAYFVGRGAFKMAMYFMEVYRERMFEEEDYALAFRYALGIALGLGVVGVGTMFISWPANFHEGMAILSCTFCLFSVFTVAYDWWVSRSTSAGPQLTLNSVTDVLRKRQAIRNTTSGN